MEKKQYRWLSLAIVMLAGLLMPVHAQERDDLQEYLDQLAAEQVSRPKLSRMKTEGTITIPVGLTEVDLSKFAGAKNRKTSLTISGDVKFTNGTLNSASDFSANGPLLIIKNGVTVVLDATASIDASATTMGSCTQGTGMTQAVRIEGGSTFYQLGDITAPSDGDGEAIHLATKNDTFIHYSGTLTGTIHNPNGGTVVLPVTKAELEDKLAAIKEMLDELNAEYNAATADYELIKGYLSADNQTLIEGKLNEIKVTLDDFNDRYDTYAEQLETEDDANYWNLKTLIDKLYTDVQSSKTTLLNAISSLVQEIIAKAVADLQARLTALSNSVNALQTRIVNVETATGQLRTGTWFFERKANEAFSNAMNSLQEAVGTSKNNIGQLITDYNTLINGSSISTIEDVVSFGQEVPGLENRLTGLTEGVETAEGLLTPAQEQYASLDVIFPTEDQNYDVRPVGLTNEIQLGFKSDRGFVLTSGGMIYFEQVEGATFKMRTQNNDYVVATSGEELLSGGTRSEATVWMGTSLGNGRYTIAEAGSTRYMVNRCTAANGQVIAGTTAAEWQILESTLDDLQAFLNELAEEGDGADGCDNDPAVAEDEPLEVVVPTCSCHVPKPFIFPSRIIHLICGCANGPGYAPIPNPQQGKKRPASFHPYHVPKNGYLRIDDLRFVDYVGGDHVIYVEGTLEITVNVVIDLLEWDWFIHVAPGGKVIWHPTPANGGYMPRIKVDKGGTLEIPEGSLGYVDNSGTVIHTGGTIIEVINRYIYRFTGGLINFMDNYGTMTHNDGSILRVYNREGATYTMNGGKVNNTVVNVVETVFINYGIFYFYGGTICGYGSRLIYNGPKGTLRIDGGKFCFDHVTDYWIVAESDFYLPGNVNYQPTKPIYLHPTVCIHILYEWIYRFHIVWHGGRPTPRIPLFKGEGGCVLTTTVFTFIDWVMPTRWRWKLDKTNNTIEARDEEVVDEDDLQAYLDWLTENKDGDAQSTEEQPQQLDLKGRTIIINHIINIPIGCHLYWKNGTVKAGNSWTGEKLFYVPEGSSLKLENLVVDFTVRTIYIVSSNVVTRWLFDIDGTVWFGQGFHVKGWLDSALQPSDGFIPGAGIRTGSTGRVYISGGRLTNVVLHLSTVLNIYILKSLAYDLYVYLPTACRRAGFRVLAPWSGFAFTLVDLSKIKFFGVPDWLPETDDEGYVSIFRAIDMGDVNNSGSVTPADAIMILYHYFAVQQTGFWLFRADMNRDGYITPADAIEALYKYFSISPARAGQPALAPGRDPE